MRPIGEVKIWDFGLLRVEKDIIVDDFLREFVNWHDAVAMDAIMIDLVRGMLFVDYLPRYAILR